MSSTINTTTTTNKPFHNHIPFKTPLPPPQKKVAKEEVEQESDISDTEYQLCRILNTFRKGKKKKLVNYKTYGNKLDNNNTKYKLTPNYDDPDDENPFNYDENEDVLSSAEMEEIEQAVPWSVEVRLKRMANENIRLLSSEMTRYLYSHEFKVMGSTGKEYTVTIGPKLDCTCRDHKVRGTHCKHILLILLKELKVTDLTNRIYVSLFPTDESLREIFSHYHPTC